MDMMSPFARRDLIGAGLTGVRPRAGASSAADRSVGTASILQGDGSRTGLKRAAERVPADSGWSTRWMQHPSGLGTSKPRPTAGSPGSPTGYPLAEHMWES